MALSLFPRHLPGSLRARLLLIVLLAALPFLALIVINSIRQRDVARRNAGQEAAQFSRLTAARQDAVFKSARDLVVTLAQLPEVRGNDAAACSLLMAQLRAQYQVYSTLGVADSKGAVWCNAIPSPPSVTVADRGWFKRVLGTQLPQVGEFQIGRISGLPGIVVAAPVRGADSSPYVVFASIRLNGASPLLQNIQLPNGAVATVIDTAGTIVARSPDAEVWVGKRMPDDEIRTLILQLQQGNLERNGADGIPRLYAFEPLSSTDNALFSAIGISTADAYLEADTRLIQSLAVIALVTALSAFAVLYFGNSLLMQPVQKLVRATRLLGQGDLSARTGISTGGEVGELAQAFDAMAVTLQARTRERERQATQLAYQARLLESVNDAVVAADGEARVTFMNPAAERLYGWSSVEIRGEDGRALFDTVFESATNQEVRASLAAVGYWHGEATQKHKDGTRILVEMHTTMLSDSRGVVTDYLSVNRDIREQKRAAEALTRSRRQLEILHTIDRAILNAQSLRELGHSTLHNLRSLVPCDRSELLLYDFDTEALALFALDTDRMTSQTEGMAVETRTDGLAILRYAPYMLLNDLAEQRDVTENLQRLYDEGIRSILYVPLKVQDEILGIIGLMSVRAHAFTHDDGELTHDVAAQLAIAIQQTRLAEQVASYAADLEKRVAARTAELNAALETQRQIRAELEASNRDLEAFSYSASHDLRAPLRAVTGFAELIHRRQRDKLDAEGQRYLDNILHAGAQMEVLIRDLLAYARVGRGDMHPRDIPLHSFFERLRATLETQMPEVAGAIELVTPLPTVRADAILLEQIFRNLLHNALQYHAPGVKPQVVVRGETSQTHACVGITDNGIGIPEEYYERIFQMLQRLHTQEEYAGTGIGLAIVKKAVEQLGGTIRVESIVGTGSTFYVELPLAQ